MTGYDPDGRIVEWGCKDMNTIYKLCHTLDDLESRWSFKETPHAVRYRMKKAGARIRLKIRRLIDDCHRKLAKFLVTNYRVVLLPEFETSKMVKRGGRKIGSKTARAMLTWSHYRFRTHLLQKAREYPWCRVILCDEPYTSKTCTRCSTLNHKLGGSKVFKCPTCHHKIDRDWNAARNILLRYLTIRRIIPPGVFLALSLAP